MAEVATFALEMRRAVDDEHHYLEGVCVPYDTITTRAAGTQQERFLPGAFAGATGAAHKIRLTDSHLDGRERRPVGVGVELRETPQALLGRFRFYNTPEGRSAWENVVEETYGGLSVGFIATKERQSYRDGAREILEARLFHVSLVDEPAYSEARVLAVRAAGDALDQRLTALLARDWSRWR